MIHHMTRRGFVRAATALGVGGMAARLAAAQTPDVIRGRVVCGAEGLPGVRCSDGRQVVSTDREGRFIIRTGGEAGPFVFVVLPRGYWTNQFYVPSEEAAQREVVFRLDKTPDRDRHTAVYFTDIHLERAQEEHGQRFDATIDEINGMKIAPAFVLAGGDICLQASVGEAYIKAAARLHAPLRNGSGNHEMMFMEAEPRRLFHQMFGPTNYSFDCGLVHYIVLDGCRLTRPGDDWKNVIGEFSERELAWLKEDLRAVPKDRPSVCAVHIPLVSTITDRRKLRAADVPWWVCANADAVIRVLKEHNVQLVLQGHLHENERIRRGSIEFAETVAVAGSWWRAKQGRENGVSGEPRGYRVLEADGTRIAHRYVSSAESRTDAAGEFVGLDSGRLRAGQPLEVNLFDASNEAKVTARIDGGAEQPWSLIGSRTDDRQVPAHHWQSVQPQLATGDHTIEVRCTDPGRPDIVLRSRLRVG